MFTMRQPTNTERIQAIAYARVSSKEQEKEGFSIAAQQKLLRQYASEQGFDLVREFVDVETAKRAGRTGFGEMLGFFKKNAAKCRVLLVEKTDRLYRNLKDYVVLDDFDLDIHLVKEGQTLSRDSRSSEKFMHGIKVLMAKNYIDNLSEEARKGMIEKAEQGIWPSYAPLGYKNVEGVHGKKIIVPDLELAPLVKRLFILCAEGTRSIEELAKQIGNEGLNRGGSRTPMPTATAHKILRQPIYMGEFEWAGKVYKGAHEPLVPRDLWEHVQNVLDRRLAKREKKTSHGFAFSSLVSCGHCGCALVGELKKGRYVYYHCTGYKGKCPERYVREEKLEAAFTGVLRQLSLDEDVLAWITEALRASHADERRFHDEAVAKLKADHQRIQNRLDVLYEDKLDGRIDAAFFDRKAKEFRAQQNTILKSIEDHQSANQSYMEEGIRILELASRAAELFEKQSAEEKRRLLNCVLKGASWQHGNLKADFRQPFEMLAKTALSNSATDSKENRIEASKGEKEIWLPDMDSNHDSRRQRPLSYR